MAQETNNEQNKSFREFKLSTIALNNKNTILLLALAIIGFGILSYRNMPKELTPEVVIPTVIIQTSYPGNPPIDIENLITRPIEKEVESVQGIKEINSTSYQGFSMISVEFNTDVDIDVALDDVKDAVDKADSELPDDLREDPTVSDIDFSEFPILNINLSGDYSLSDLKGYAEYLEEEIERVDQVSRVELKGITDREVKINLNPHKLEAYDLAFQDIERTITAENFSISGGELVFGATKRSVRITGEFETVEQIQELVVKNNNGQLVHLKDVADVRFDYKDADSYARLDQKPVVSAQVIKKSGENLLAATDQIFTILDEAKEQRQLPEDLTVTTTNDQSDMIRKQLNNLENSMILGVIFVVLVLYYFLGTRNALFVGIAIPMSMFLAFIVLGILDYRLNMIVLFSLILALGLLVDNSIVVVENIYRFVSNGYKPFYAAKKAVGEIAMPIVTSTITTLSAFLPLAFWKGITGEFMRALPITLIVVLTSSLLVALVIIPVFSASFINVGTNNNSGNGQAKKKSYRAAGIVFAAAIFFFLIKLYAIANLLLLLALIVTLNAAFFRKVQIWFQRKFLPYLEKVYSKALNFALRRYNPVYFFIGTILLLFVAVGFYMMRNTDVLFFPENEPNYINVQAELPIGSDISATDSVMKIIETDINTFMEPHEDIVESVLTNVGSSINQNIANVNPSNVGYSTITFVDYEDRQDKSTSEIMQNLTTYLSGKYPGVDLTTEKNRMGPPTGNPINIEVSGEDYDKLISLTDSLQNRIEEARIPGIEGLKVDLDLGKPEAIVSIDREKARQYGLSTSQIAMQIRTALFGKEISDFKVGEEEYPINMRLKKKYRNNMAALLNQKISVRGDNGFVDIPISSVADIKYSTTYGAVKRKELDRVITIYSNVMEGYNATEINNQIAQVLNSFEMPEGYKYEFTGQQQEQQESFAFLVNAMIISVVLILIILVTQFNSLIKPVIIIASVIFSTIGVFAGLGIFKMDFVVVMTGIGIVSLAGIVVNNAIVLVDYIELLKKRRRVELGLAEGAFLPVNEATDCVIQGGKTRLRPVLLTAITTILGLLPLAVGLNMDFGTMLSEFDPQLYFGGDMVIFWGPISWTVIFGLAFATFLTLIIVPVMYRISIILQKRIMNMFNISDDSDIVKQ